VKGGGTITFSNIDITGSLRGFHAPAASLAGTLTADALGTVTLGSIDGNVNVAGAVANFTAGNLAGTFKTGGNVARLKFGDISGNVNIAGNLANLTALNISGSVYAGGILGHLKAAAVTGLIASAAQIVNLTATSVSGATVLAGANLGSDGVLNGTGTAQDTFAAGSIGTFHINGSISSSFIGAGVNPNDGTFGNAGDTAAGAGVIRNIFAKSVDTATHFEASAFGIARLGIKVNPTTDANFIVL